MSDTIEVDQLGRVSLPEAIVAAQEVYWDRVKPYLDSLPYEKLPWVQGLITLDMQWTLYLTDRMVKLMGAAQGQEGEGE